MLLKTYTTNHKTWDDTEIRVGMWLLINASLLDGKSGEIEVEILDIGDDYLTTLYTYPKDGKHKLVYIDTYDVDYILEVLKDKNNY